MSFTDVSASAYYADAVGWAYRYGIANGTGNNQFSPDQKCTRAEIITFLWRAYGSPEPTIDNPFIDVTETDYYYKAVLWAREKGLIRDFEMSTNKFYPDFECQRFRAMYYLYAAAGAPSVTAKRLFNDVDPSTYYGGAVTWAVENGIANGTGDKTFSPTDICTRAQIMTFIYRNLAK